MKIYPRGARIGPYEVVELLPTGRGGMAAVYLARPRPGHAASSPPLVALKVAETPHDDFLKYEAEHLEHLRHPNIVQVLPIPHTGTNQNRSIFIARTEPTSSTSPFYIAVAYMRGGSVEQLLKLRGRLTLIEAVEIACQVAEALIYLHSQQLVHLDIKGSNILFREPLRRWKAKVPQVVVSDFGIAWSTEREQLPTVYGSQFYTAPERAAGEPPRPHNDIFSLGVLLYEMLAGRMPFTGVVAPGAVVAEHARPSVLNPAVSPELERVILKALATEPARRYGSMQEFKGDLERLPGLRRPGRVRLPLLQSQREYLAASLSGVALLLALLLVVVGLGGLPVVGGLPVDQSPTVLAASVTASPGTVVVSTSTPGATATAVPTSTPTAIIRVTSTTIPTLEATATPSSGR